MVNKKGQSSIAVAFGKWVAAKGWHGTRIRSSRARGALSGGGKEPIGGHITYPGEEIYLSDY